MISDSNEIDPACFDDPFALQTDWAPLKTKGPKFRTHNLVQVNSYRLEFRAATWKILRHHVVPAAIIIAMTLLFINFNVLSFVKMIIFNPKAMLSNSEPIFAIFPIIVIISMIRKIYPFIVPVVFDKRKDTSWRGCGKYNDIAKMNHSSCLARLNDIYALQIVVKHVKESESSYCSYELNAILKDSSRINVIVHGDKAKLKADAAVLAKFLNKPLWDVTASNAWSSNEKVHDFMEKICEIKNKNPELITSDTRKIYEEYENTRNKYESSACFSEKRKSKIDPSQFKDTLAMQTEWCPLVKGGGANFVTHNLKITINLAKFKASEKLMRFTFIWIAVSGVMSCFFLLFGLVPLFFGIFMLRSYTAPILFDRKNGFFQKGRKTDFKGNGSKLNNYAVKLDNIHALQLVPKSCDLHCNYELNLVLKDSSRCYVIDHNDKEKLRADAEELSRFLEKPLWDATEKAD